MESDLAAVFAVPLMCLTTVCPCGIGFIIVLFYALTFAITIAGLVLWIVMLLDIIQRPHDQFPNPSGDQKTLWVLIVVLAGWIGAIIYYLMVYKKVGAARK